MNTCPHCEADNRPGARFCSHCGNPLEPMAESAPRGPEEATAPPGWPRTDETTDGASNASAASPDSTVPEDATAMPEPEVGGMATAEPPEEPGGMAAAPDSPDVTGPEEPEVSVVAEAGTEHDADPEMAEPVPVVSDADDTSPEELSDTESVSPAPSSASSPLAVGTRIAGRYRIVAVLAAEDAEQRYRVEDLSRCPSCGTPVQDGDEERFCTECGADLDAPDLPWPTLLLRELPPPPDLVPTEGMLSWNGRTFEWVAEPEPAAVTAPDTFERGVHLLAAARSDTGLVRAGRPDEDSIFALTLGTTYDSICHPAVGLYLVADGMGGHGDGELASRLAVETIGPLLIHTIVLPTLQGAAPGETTIMSQIDSAIQAANDRILDQARRLGNDMGTTVTLALVLDETAYVANVGDSRTYLWNREGLQRITHDHSAVFNLVEKGILEEEDIYTHPQRSEIYRSLGFRPQVEVDQFQLQLEPDNMLVLCCDGLWEMLRTDGIAEVLMASGLSDPQIICGELVRRANQAGGEDNISVVVVRAAA